MLRQQIEYWALQIIDRVKKGQPKEDDYVECKGTWPTEKAARQIAGCANAAHGEPVLWLIGVDEKTGISGVVHEELSSWWDQVKVRFDGLPPSITVVNMLVEDKPIVALLLETSGAPYVIKNEDGKGSIQREVPWREANSTRSATRNDLLRILVPLQRTPIIEPLGGRIEVVAHSDRTVSWNMYLDIYITPRSRERVVIPNHRCHGWIASPPEMSLTEFEEVGLRAPTKHVTSSEGIHSLTGPTEPASFTVLSTSTELVADGPGMFSIFAYAKMPENVEFPTTLKSQITLMPVDAEHGIELIHYFLRTLEPGHPGGRATYRLAIETPA